MSHSQFMSEKTCLKRYESNDVCKAATSQKWARASGCQRRCQTMSEKLFAHALRKRNFFSLDSAKKVLQKAPCISILQLENVTK